MRKVAERVFVGAHEPGSVFWAAAAVILVGTAWSAVFEGGALVVEGLISAAVLVGVISINSRVLGWKFWPW